MAGSLSIKIEIVNVPEVNKLLSLGDRFEKIAEKTFGDLVNEAHKYLIRITPIDTGEARGGWTSWLDKNQIDYSRQFNDISIAEKAPGRDYHFDEDSIQRGKAQSTFEAPNPFDITIINSVPHAIFLDEGTSRMQARNFVELAKFKTEYMFEKNFTALFTKIEQNGGELVEPDPPEEPAA